MAITLGSFSTVNGRSTLTGLSGSGLDTQGLIEGLTKAKEIPKVNLEDRITLNGNKVDAFGQLRTILGNLKDAANFLRNPPGVQNQADNVFKYRSASLSSNTAIAASNYMSVSATPGSAIQNYNVTDITSLAKVTKQRTGTFAIANADTAAVTAAATPGFFKAGTVTINGADITLEEGDTLNEVAAKFNSVKATTGIEVSIIQSGSNAYTLSFSATTAGTAASFDLNDPATVTADPDGVLSFISRTNLVSNGTFSTNIDGFADASLGTGSIAHDGVGALQLDGDGAGGNEAFAQQAMTTEIGKQYTVTATLADLAGSAFIRIGTSADVSDPANFDVEDFEVAADGTVSFTFTATSTTSYLTINSDTNTEPFTVDDLSVVDSSAEAVVDTQAATDAVFTIDGVQVTRASNTITDVVSGLTFNLLQETPMSTSIGVNINADQSLPLSGVANFINVYNELRVFVTKQSATNDDGTYNEEAYLAGENILRSLNSSIASQLSAVVDGAGDYNSLSEVGISFADLPETDENPYTNNILNVDEEKFASALASSFTSVEQLFGFSFVSDNSNVALFKSSNKVTATSVSLNIDPGAGLFEATIDGETVTLTATAVGSTSYRLTGPEGSSIEGLSLIYASTEAGTANLTLSQGIADRIYNDLTGLLNEDSGQLKLEINAIEESNVRFQTQIERIDDQVARFREQLIRQFSALESTLSALNTLLDSLSAQQDALNNN